MSDLNKKYNLSPKEFAKSVGVSTSTVRRWENEGIIRSVRNKSGYRLFSSEDINTAKDYHNNLYFDKVDRGHINIVTDKESNLLGLKGTRIPFRKRHGFSLVVIFAAFLLLGNNYLLKFNFQFPFSEEIDKSRINQYVGGDSFAKRTDFLNVLSAESNKLNSKIVSNIPWEFRKNAFGNTIKVIGNSVFEGNISANGYNVNLGEGKITASNVIYSLTAGNGVTITEGQNPTISTIITTVDGISGDVDLVEGNNIAISRVGNKLTLNGAIYFPGTDLDISGTTFSIEPVLDSVTAINNLSSISHDSAFNIADSNNLSHLFITTSGNIGIGTTNPSYTLDVIGTGRFTGDFRLTGALYDSLSVAGTSGQYLKSTATGTSWTSFVPGSDILPTGTEGQTIYNNAGVWTVNSGLYYDDTNSRVGIGGTSPASLLDVHGTSWLRGVSQGTSGLYVNSSGNVGVGTTGPGSKLDIASAADSIITLTNTNTAIGDRDIFGSLQFYSSDSDNTDSRIAVFVRATAHTSQNTINPEGRLEFGTSVGASPAEVKMVLDRSGNVGIGTTGPNTKLEVVGNSSWTSPGSVGRDSFTQTIVASSSQGTPGIGFVTTSGGAYYGSAIWANHVASSRAGLNLLYSADNSGQAAFTIKQYSPSAAAVYDRLIVNYLGNVGIGTTNPQFTLDVNGTQRAVTSVSSPIFQGDSGAATFGNVAYATSVTGSTLSVIPTSWTATPTISGLITATSGLTSNGTITANSGFTQTAGAFSVTGTIGLFNLSSTMGITTSDWGISTSGAMTGISGISNDGSYTQTGTSANTFTGATSFTGTGTALSVTNNGYIGGTLGIGTTSPQATVDIDSGNLRIGGLTASMGVYTDANKQLTSTVPTSGTLGFWTRSGTTLWPSTNTDNVTTMGNVGIGSTSPSAKLTINGTTEQLRLSYDASNYQSFTVDDTGDLFIAQDGGAATLALTNGSVGIATTAPASLLDVHGTAWIRGATGGTSGLYVKSDGNVGVGTTGPGSQLDIYKATNVGMRLIGITDAGSGITGISTGTTQIFSLTRQLTETGTLSISAYGGIGLATGATSGPSTSYALYAKANGNVGIGTTSPFGKLDIVESGVTNEDGIITGASLGRALRVLGNGAAYLVGRDVTNDIEFAMGSSVSGYSFAGSVSNHGFRLRTNNLDRVSIDTSGNVGIGTTNPQSALEIGGSGNLRIGGLTASMGVYTDANKQLTSTAPTSGTLGYWQRNSTYVSPATLTDYVGIGTTSPVSMFDVRGTAYLRGADANQGLFVNSSGNVGVGTTGPLEKLHVMGDIVLAQDTTPLISFRGADNVANGMALYYDDSASIFHLRDQSGSANRLSVTQAGNVGIGTVSPGTKLSVKGAGLFGSTDAWVQSAVSAGTDLAIQGNIGIGTTAPTEKLDIYNGSLALTAGAYPIKIKMAGSSVFEAASSAYLAINKDNGWGNVSISGNVGIGTTGPAMKLHLNDTVTGNVYLRFTGLASTGTGFSVGIQDSTGASLWNSQNNYMRFATNDTERMRISSTGGLSLGSTYVGTNPGDGSMIISGNVGIGTTTPWYKLSVGTGTGNHYMQLIGDTNSSLGLLFSRASTTNEGAIFYDYSTDKMSFRATNVSDTMTLYNGNVGIGTTGPGYKLDVAGDTAIRSGNHLWLFNPVNDAATAIYNTASTGTGNITFRTGGVDNVVINNSGNVGIGTTSPGTKLEVAGNEILSFDPSRTAVSNIRAGGALSYTGNFSLFTSDGVAGEGIDIDYWNGAAYYPAIRIDNVTGGGATRGNLVLMKDGGNVGIGTTAPGRLLEVSGSDNNARIRLNSTDTTAGQYSGFEIFGSGAFKGGFFVQNSAKDVVQIWDNSAAVINLKAGNVGIGTTGPASKLDVAAGNIRLSQLTPANDAKSIISYQTPGNSLAGSGSLKVGMLNLDTFPDRGSSIKFVQEGTSDVAGYTQSSIGFWTWNSGVDNGLERMRITTTGNVGIGTTSPSATLQVYGSGTTNPFLVSSSTGTGLMVITNQGNVGIGTTGPANILEVSSATPQLYVTSTGTSTARVRMNNTGATFHVGIEQSTGAGILAGSSAYAAVLNQANNYPMQFGTNNAVRMTIDNAGNVGIGTTAPVKKLQVNMGTNINLAAYSAGSTAYWGAIDDVGGSLIPLHIRGSETHISGGNVLLVEDSGNVGIGTTNPSALLHLGIGSTAVVGQKIVLASGATANAFEVNTSTGVGGDLVVMQSNGNVGIGTTAPLAKLGVLGNLSIGATYGSLAAPVSGLAIEGNVGIGTTGPGAKLDVNGDVHISADAVKTWTVHDAAKLSMNSMAFTTLGTTNTYIWNNMYYNAGAYRAYATGYGMVMNYDAIGGNFYIRNTNASAVADAVLNPVDVFTLDKNGNITSTGTLTVSGTGNSSIAGNVGIGTTAPGGQLDIWDGTNRLAQVFDAGTVGNLFITGGISTYDTTVTDGYVEASGLCLGNGTNCITSWDSASGLWSLTSNVIHPDTLTYDFAIGASTLTAPFSVDESANTVRIGEGSVSNAILNMYASDGDTGSITYTTNDSWAFEGGNVGIGTTAPGEKLEVAGNVKQGWGDGYFGWRYTSGGTYTAGMEMTGTRGLRLFSRMDDSSGYIGFITGTGTGTEQVRITNAGNVGIGTTAPGALLNIVGANTANRGQLSVQGTTGVDARATFYNGSTLVGHIYTSGADLFSILAGSGDELSLGANDAEVIRIKSGNVGIGTTGPGSKLHIRTGASGGTPYGADYLTIEDDARAAIQLLSPNTGDAAIYFGDNDNSTKGQIIYDHTNDSMGLSASGRIMTLISGNVGIGTTGPSSKLSILSSAAESANFGGTYGTMVISGTDASSANAKHQIKFQGGPSNATYGTAIRSFADVNYEHGGTLQFLTDNTSGTLTERVTINRSGNVGIGTTAPGAKLHVAGADAAMTVFENSGSRGWLRFDEAGSTRGWLGYSDSGGLATGTIDDSMILRSTGALHLISNTGAATNGITITSGNVGIGTTAPTYSLQVDQGTGGGNGLLVRTGGYTGLQITGDAVLSSYPSATKGVYLKTYNSGGTQRTMLQAIMPSSGEPNLVLVPTAGNVGIGTTSPNAKLQVAGSGQFGWLGKLSFEYDNIGSYSTGMKSMASGRGLNIFTLENDSNGGILFTTGTTANPTDVMKILNNGNVGIGTTGPGAQLHVKPSAGNGRVIIDGAGVSGNDAVLDLLELSETANEYGIRVAYDGGDDKLYLGSLVGGVLTNHLTVDRTSGNVGIGTTGPGEKLHISGSAVSIGSLVENTSSSGYAYYGLRDDTTNVAATFGYGNASVADASRQDKAYIYTAASTDLLFKIANTDAGIWKSTGNVGIGTTSPQGKLHISGTGTGANMLVDQTAPGVGANAQISLGLSGTIYSWFGVDGAANALINGSVQGDTSFRSLNKNILFSTDNGTTANVYIKNGGNVGIGTTAPTTKLDVAGDVIVGDATAWEGNLTIRKGTNEGGQLSLAKFGSSQNWYVDVPGNDSFRIIDNASVRLSIDTAGNVGIGTVSPAYKLEVAGSFNATSVYSNGVLLSPGTGSNWSVSGSNIYRSSGNVGVGTTSPSQKLEIKGTNPAIQITNSASQYAWLGVADTANFLMLGQAVGDIGLRAVSGKLLLATGNRSDFVIDTSGNVGIGTTGPGGTLPNSFTNHADSRLLEILAQSASGDAGISLRRGTTVGLDLWTDGNAGGTYIDSGWTGAGGKMYFRTATLGTPVNAMTIDVSGNISIPVGTLTVSGTGNTTIAGNVGIGTTGPGAKLDVRGGEGVFIIGNTNKAVGQNTDMYFFSGTGTSISGLNIGSFVRSSVTQVSPSLKADLGFWANNGDNNFEGMRLTNGGNVGIGTTGPGAKLDILAASGVNSLQITNNNMSEIYFTGAAGTNITQSASNQPLYISANGGPVYLAATTDGTQVTLLNNGNVGIGTTAPGAKLEIYDATAANSFLKATDGTYSAGLGVYAGGAKGPAGSWFGSITNHPVGIRVNNTNVVTIDTSGNVGIGTTSPAHKLDVAGNIMISNTNGRVFFNETETFIGRASTDNYHITGSSAGDLTIRSNTGQKLLLGTGTALGLTINNGNVGIGTTAPGAALEVRNSSALPVAWGTAGTRYGELTQDTGRAVIRGASGMKLSLAANAGADSLVIDTSGNVGIGTTGPNGRLSLGTNVATKNFLLYDDPVNKYYLGLGVASYEMQMFYGSSGHLSFGTISTTDGSTWAEKMRLSSTGGLSVGTATWSGTDPGAGNVTIQGNVGIGTTNPQRKLEVNGSIRMGALITGAGSAVAVYRDANGDLADSTSSIRFKDNITPFENILPRLQDLRAVRFDWNSLTSTPGMADFGMIAEEVNQVLPELVTYEADGITPHGLKYEKMGLFALKGIQELNLVIEEQEGEISSLKSTIVPVSESTTKFDELSLLLDGVKKESSESATLVKDLTTRVSLLEQLFGEETATSSASISRSITENEVIFDKKIIAENDLTVLGKTVLSDVGVTGDLTVGILKIGSLDNSINALGSTLKLQSEIGAGNIEIFGDKIVMTSTGDIKVTGKIKAETVAAKKFTVLGLTTEIEESLGKSVGQSAILAGQTEIMLENTNIDSSSKIFLTPTTSTEGQSLIVFEKSDGRAKIVIDAAVDHDIKFDYWIVGVE